MYLIYFYYTFTLLLYITNTIGKYLTFMIMTKNRHLSLLNLLNLENPTKTFILYNYQALFSLFQSKGMHNLQYRPLASFQYF